MSIVNQRIIKNIDCNIMLIFNLDSEDFEDKTYWIERIIIVIL